MHDPSTVAFEIRSPFWRRVRMLDGSPGKERYYPPLVTIWHEDPQTDGSDDSCGWFKRARHGDPDVREKIRRSFAFEWDPEYGGWFFPESGDPRLSVSAIVLCMFRAALWEHYSHMSTKKRGRVVERFLKKNLLDILHFAENPTDSMHPSITQRYGKESRDDRIDSAVSVVYGYILRLEQRWWQHARWHVHHWRIQFHPWYRLKRWLWERCTSCGETFKDGSVSVMGGHRNEKTGKWVKHCYCSTCRDAITMREARERHMEEQRKAEKEDFLRRCKEDIASKTMIAGEEVEDGIGEPPGPVPVDGAGPCAGGCAHHRD